VEANASGTPVIAYGAGGVLDTHVRSNRSFFKRQTRMHQSALLDE